MGAVASIGHRSCLMLIGRALSTGGRCFWLVCGHPNATISLSALIHPRSRPTRRIEAGIALPRRAYGANADGAVRRTGRRGRTLICALRDATRTIDSMTHPPTRPPLGPGTWRSAAILRLPD